MRLADRQQTLEQFPIGTESAQTQRPYRLSPLRRRLFAIGGQFPGILEQTRQQSTGLAASGTGQLLLRRTGSLRQQPGHDRLAQRLVGGW